MPEDYIFPPDIRPGKLIVPLCKTIPVIDLSMAEARDRNSIIKKVLNASQEFGFFQEFFDMPADDKASVYSDDPSQSCRLFTNSYNYFGGIISDTLVILQRNAFNCGLKSQLDIDYQQWGVKSTEHRAVTNSNNAWTTIVTFINPCHDSIVEPTKALINGGSPPLYRAFQYKDFLANYTAKTGDTNTVLEPYKLQA
ncbi:hypothetical protein ACSBR2_032129 [Camellia fascicularis]